MIIAKNKKVNYNYNILEEYDAGIVLLGCEVKSIRNASFSMNDSFVYVKDHEVWIKNLRVSRYKQTHSYETHDENREKKLLLTGAQIEKIGNSLKSRGISCVPTIVFIKNNRIKVKIAIVSGKKNWDKRDSIKKKDIDREIQKGLV